VLRGADRADEELVLNAVLVRALRIAAVALLTSRCTPKRDCWHAQKVETANLRATIALFARDVARQPSGRLGTSGMSLSG
jgi:hypothetical protein